MTMPLSEMICEDIQYDMTPDLPTLRYRGSTARVFLWDNLQDENQLKEVLREGLGDKKFRKIPLRFKTNDFYLPLYSLSPSSPYPAYCCEDPSDIFYLDGPDYVIGETPLQLSGYLFEVPLDILVDLDYYYEQQTAFDRVEIEVSPGSTYRTMKAFTYMNDIDHVASFIPKTAEYRLKDHIDPTTFSKTMIGSTEVYSYN